MSADFAWSEKKVIFTKKLHINIYKTKKMTDSHNHQYEYLNG